jgi:Protein of unknown function (DUF4058)
MVAIANQLQPKLDPRYVTSIEERVFIEGPQRRVPDVWIQKVRDAEGMTARSETDSDTPVIVEVDNLEIRETRVELLSLCCVSRWPLRNRFELYPRTLRQRLPRLKIPLADEDPDTTLDLQAAFEQVYVDGRYLRRIRSEQKCKPRLSSKDQT